MTWTIYDYRDARGINVIREWLEGLQKPDRIRMVKRIDLLQMNGNELCPGLAGPLNESKHLYKIKVNGNVAARLLLCKGPIEMETEYTLLYGAFERDDKLPEGAIERAEQNRTEVISDPRGRRCQHERVA